MRHLTDTELEAAISRSYKDARDAPFGEFNLHADGSAEVRNPTTAWARHSEEWCRLCAERDRRVSDPSPDNREGA